MEILKNLSEEEMDSLKHTFNTSNPQRALTPKSFHRTLRRIIRSKDALDGRLPRHYLRGLFADIDVAGTGYVSWGEFTMFAIDQARNADREGTIGASSYAGPAQPRQSSHRRRPGGSGGSGGTNSSTRRKEGGGTRGVRKGGGPLCESNYSSSSSSSSSDSDMDDDERVAAQRRCSYVSITEPHPNNDTMYIEEVTVFKQYHVDKVVVQQPGMNVVDLRTLYRARKAVHVAVDSKSSSHVTLFNMDDQKLTHYGRLPKHNEAITAWDYIPAVGSVGSSNSIACAYNGGLLQIFSLEKRHSIDELLPLRHSMLVSETQTALQWSSMYSRLMMGSRGGVVSTWDVDQDRVSNQEKLHGGAITALRMCGGNTMYTASLDNINSVKATDLEKAVLRYSFNDHMTGGALCLEVDEEFFFSSGLEPKIVQRPLQTPKSQASFFYDTTQPHTGRISALFRIPNSPVLVSGDTLGMVKMWDLRMGSCLQTFSSTLLTSVKNPVVTMSNVLGDNTAGIRGSLQEHDIATTAETDGNPKKLGRSYRQGKRKNAAFGRNRDRRLEETYRAGTRNTRSAPSGSTGAGFALSTAGRGGRKNRNTTEDTLSSVNAFCFSPATSHVLVCTPREIVVLSNNSTTRPELVDDERPCRFILAPKEGQVLTVHERGVKLWDIATGYALYYSTNDLVEGDISACALVEPLKRQFLLGTMSGEVASFSVALAQRVTDFTEVLRAAEEVPRGSQVLSLMSMPKFRDYPYPYSIVVTAGNVVMAPMMASGEFGVAQLVPFHGIRALLAAHNNTIKDAKLRGSHLYLTVSDSSVLLADLLQGGTVIATFHPPTMSHLEGITLANFPATGLNGANSRRESALDDTASRDDDSQVGGGNALTLFLTPDSSGKLIVGGTVPKADRPNPLASLAVSGRTHGSGELSRLRRRSSSLALLRDMGRRRTIMNDLCMVFGDWPPCIPQSGGTVVPWRWFKQSYGCGGPRYVDLADGGGSEGSVHPRPSRPSASTHVVAADGNAMSSRHSILHPLGAPAELSPQRSSSTTSTATARSERVSDVFGGGVAIIVTHVYFFTTFEVVVTGDERGRVRLWDVAGIASGALLSAQQMQLEQPSRPPAECIPFFITGWEAHARGFTALEGVLCPRTGLPVVVTAGTDCRVCLWSADGEPLGTLAMGREMNALSRGRRFELDVYAYTSTMVDSTTLQEKWSVFERYMAARTAVSVGDSGGGIARAVSARWRRDGNLGAHRLRSQGTAGDGGGISPRQNARGTPQQQASLNNSAASESVFVTEAPVPAPGTAGAEGMGDFPVFAEPQSGRRRHSNQSNGTCRSPPHPNDRTTLLDATPPVKGGGAAENGKESSRANRERAAAPKTTSGQAPHPLPAFAEVRPSRQQDFLVRVIPETAPPQRRGVKAARESQRSRGGGAVSAAAAAPASSAVGRDGAAGRSNPTPPNISLARTGVVSGALLPPLRSGPNNYAPSLHQPGPSHDVGGGGGGAQQIFSSEMDRATTVRRSRSHAQERRSLFTPGTSSNASPLRRKGGRTHNYDQTGELMQSLLPSMNR